MPTTSGKDVRIGSGKVADSNPNKPGPVDHVASLKLVARQFVPKSPPLTSYFQGWLKGIKVIVCAGGGTKGHSFGPPGVGVDKIFSKTDPSGQRPMAVPNGCDR